VNQHLLTVYTFWNF